MTRKPYKAVIFDLDGTLLNTLEDISDSMNYVLRNKGFPIHKLDTYNYFVGEGVARLVAQALPQDKRNEEIIKECYEDFKYYYSLNWKVKTKLYQGVPEMLNALTERDIKLSILSNKPHEFTLQCVDEFFSQWIFDVVLGMKDSVPPKPDPTGALQIAEKFKMETSCILYLGDTSVDMKTAVNAKMLPIGVLWGFRSREELLQNGAKVLLNNPMDILEIL